MTTLSTQKCCNWYYYYQYITTSTNDKHILPALLLQYSIINVHNIDAQSCEPLHAFKLIINSIIVINTCSSSSIIMPQNQCIWVYLVSHILTHSTPPTASGSTLVIAITLTLLYCYW